MVLLLHVEVLVAGCVELATTVSPLPLGAFALSYERMLNCV